jgi:septal ring factor EnvC (AmiA/AmiB activator)
MPDALSQLLPTVKSLVTFVSGGGLVAAITKLWTTYMQSDQQEHTQAMDLVQTLRGDIDSLQARQDEVEHQLAQSQRSEALLTAQVQLLIERIDTLLDRLDEYEPVSPEERDRYTSLTLDPRM